MAEKYARETLSLQELEETERSWEMDSLVADLPTVSEAQARKSIEETQSLRKVRCARLDLSSVAWPKHIVLENCVLDELVMDNATLQGGMQIDRCHIKNLNAKNLAAQDSFRLDKVSLLEDANFDDANFLGAAVFERTVFGKAVNLRGVQFHKLAHFHVRFHGPARFRKACFHDESFFNRIAAYAPLNFELATFEKDTGFRQIYCVDKADFRSANFSGRAFFQCSTFQGGIRLRGVRFEREAYFDRSRFLDECECDHLRSEEMVTFAEGEFAKGISLSKGNFSVEVLFSDATFAGPVALDGSVFAQRLDFRGATFQSTVSFTGLLVNQMVIKAEQIRNRIASEKDNKHLDAKEDFNLLRFNFEKLGEHSAAEWAYYNFRRQERMTQTGKSPLRLIGRFFNWLVFDLCCGYGTKPLRLLLLAMGVVVAFALVYLGGASALRHPAGQPFQFAQAFYYSFMVFSTMGSSEIEPLLDSCLKYVVSIEAFLGIFLTTLFVGTCTRKIAS